MTNQKITADRDKYLSYSVETMMTRSEQRLPIGPDKELIYLQKWQNTAVPAQKIFLITHGVAEHSECHQGLAQSLINQGFIVYGWDLPGHGKSYGARGYVSAFDEFTSNLNAVIEQIQRQEDDLPLVIFGHSLGGLITLKFLLDYSKTSIQAVSLSSPAVGVKIKVPLIKDQAARFLYKFAPKITIAHQITFEDLSRDSALIKTYYKDPLRHKKFSAPLYLGILEAMNDVRERAHQIKFPLILQAAGVDRIVDTLASQELYNKLGSAPKDLKVYADSFHEIFNDINKQEVIDDLLLFLKQF